MVLQARGQNNRPFLVVQQCQRIPEIWDWFLNLRLIAGVRGLDVDATASGRLSWLERGGRRLKPIRKVRGLSSNRALF